jgi:TonB family protein
MKKVYLSIIPVLLLLFCPARRELVVPLLLEHRIIYPDEAQELGVEGKVFVRVFVGKDGRAKDVRLAKSSSNKLLDSAAVLSARTFVFSPAMIGDEPKSFWVLVPIEFRLTEMKPEIWLIEAQLLQNSIAREYTKEKVEELYGLYKQMIYAPRIDRINLEINDYIKSALLDSTAQLWKGFWSAYPAKILLFIDIIYRYPDSFTGLRARADFNRYFKKEKITFQHVLTHPKVDSLINRLSRAIAE